MEWVSANYLLLRPKHGVSSRRKARRIVTQTHNDWLESFNDDDIGQKNLQFQCLGRVERTVRKAE